MFKMRVSLLTSVFLMALNISIAQEKTVSKTEKPDEYIKAVEQYCELINNKNYHDAYNMLSDCRIALYNADSSRSDFYPRQDYELWLKREKYIESISVFEIKRYYFTDPLKYTADKGNAEAILGIKRYDAVFKVKYSKNSPIVPVDAPSWTQIVVVKSNDNKIRLLQIYY